MASSRKIEQARNRAMNIISDFGIEITDDIRAHFMELHTEVDIDAYRRDVLGIAKHIEIPYIVKHTNQYGDY